MKPETRMRLATYAAMAAAVFEPLGIFRDGPWRVVGKRTRPIDWVGPHQGKQEIARRLRQIDRGQLTKSNGLMT